MAMINLLPWRELKREQEKKQFSSMLLMGALFAIGVVIIINYYADSLISEQMALNQRLTDEINIYNDQIKEIAGLKKMRTALISRMNIIQNLQATRSLTVHLFDELIRVLPDGVYLTKVEHIKDGVTLLGYAQSNTNISSLMRNIENNPWIQHPELTEIKKSDQEVSTVENEFKLSFILKPKTTQDVNDEKH